MHWTSNISFTINRYNCLKSGSVWALYLLFVIIRRARFCNFDMRSHSKPQFVIPNWRCERISESYINFIAEMGKYRFSLFITPSVRKILFAIFLTCEFQLIYSFTVRPRKLNSVTPSIRVLFIMRHGIMNPSIRIMYHKLCSQKWEWYSWQPGAWLNIRTILPRVTIPI